MVTPCTAWPLPTQLSRGKQKCLSGMMAMEKLGKAGLTPLPPYFAASSGMGCWTPGGHLPSAEMDTIWASRSSHASEEGASTVHLNAGDTLGCLILQIRVPGPGSRSSNSVQEFEDSGDLFHTLFSKPKFPILSHPPLLSLQNFSCETGEGGGTCDTETAAEVAWRGSALQWGISGRP